MARDICDKPLILGTGNSPVELCCSPLVLYFECVLDAEIIHEYMRGRVADSHEAISSKS